MALTVTKLATANFKPKRLLAAAEDVREMLLGTLVGIVSGTVNRRSPDGDQVFTGLSGIFEFTDADEKNEAIRSGILYLPEAIQGPIQELIEKDDVQQVRIAAEVYAIRASNAVGYSHMYRFIDEPDTVDPLKEIKQALLASKVKQTLISKDNKEAEKKK